MLAAGCTAVSGAQALALPAHLPSQFVGTSFAAHASRRIGGCQNSRLERLCKAQPERRFEACTPEDYPQWRRTDFSTQHAYEARHAFMRCIAEGEASVDLAAAALYVAAEDDALVSHSTVQLPVEAYQQRLQRMATELARLLAELPAASTGAEEGLGAGSSSSARGSDAGGGTSSSGEQGGEQGSGASGPSSEPVLQVLRRYLFEQQGFRAAGRSALPGQAILDHPGVWERASHAYLNEVLTRKQGIPAALAIILEDLVRRLLLMGAMDFAVKVDCSDLGARPRVAALPLSRSAVVRPDGTVLNTCSTDALAEMLRFLKRCFWPFAWDSGAGIGGGFAGAAKVFLEGESDAAMQAISRTAKHRLERGIWTSPGAGDIRRALAACERLVLLLGDSCPQERRDLAVLLMHVGRFTEAKAELLQFMRSTSAASGAAPALSLTPTGAVVTAGGQTLGEQQLTDRLLSLLSGVEAAPEALSLEGALRRPPPAAQQDDDSRLPLTW
ncbi:hypothetical protein ABPG77_009731 [Micractinium sp. CCAP 211/92]